VWQGGEVEVLALGVGRLVVVEQAVRMLHAEATARRGPWAFTEPVVVDGTATVAVGGPGGPIAGVPITFAAGGWSSVVPTGPDGRATAEIPADAAAVDVTAEAPGPALALVAPGSQRLAMAGPPDLLQATALAPPATTTTTTPPTTTTTTTTTTPPPPTTTTMPTPTMPPTTTADTTTTAVPPTTTTGPPASSAPTTSTPVSTTTSPPTTTQPPPTTVSSPPTLPRTGGGGRGAVRLGSVLFALGAGAVLVAAPRRRAR
jgi:hypothetical protein